MGTSYHKMSFAARQRQLDRVIRYQQSEAGKQSARRSNRRLHHTNKVACLKHYGGDPPKCACCGETNLGFLTLDHVNNDAKAHKQQMKTAGGPLFTKLVKLGFPTDFELQVLCCNCNLGRQWNDGICPHKKPWEIGNGSGHVPRRRQKSLYVEQE